MDIRVNAELRDLIPALTEQERRDLEASIQRRGLDTPLLVATLDWDEPPVLVDGYARHALATKLGVPFEVTYFDFTTTPEYVREGLERVAKNKIARARGDREAARLKIMDEVLPPETVAEIDESLEAAVLEAKLRELKLHRLNHALARRNMERFDLILTAWRRNQELYRRKADAERQKGNKRGGAIVQGVAPDAGTPEADNGRIRAQLARDTGAHEDTCRKALTIIRTAEGDFPKGYENLQTTARDLVAQIRDKASNMSISGAYKYLKSLKDVDTTEDDGLEDTHIPEDDAIKAFHRMRESVFSHDPSAVAARLRTKSPGDVARERRAALQEAAWLESFAEALEPSEVSSGVRTD
jgi:hypothetical protein